MTKVVRFRWLGIGHLLVKFSFWISMARKEVEVDKKTVKKKRPELAILIEQVLNFWLTVACTSLWLAKTFRGTISDS